MDIYEVLFLLVCNDISSPIKPFNCCGWAPVCPAEQLHISPSEFEPLSCPHVNARRCTCQQMRHNCIMLPLLTCHDHYPFRRKDYPAEITKYPTFGK